MGERITFDVSNSNERNQNSKSNSVLEKPSNPISYKKIINP